ncbi:MAG: hypothetical protein KC492_11315 [Myxococcales bacterium]|nr:hypothetical protein [Myxococcales bacterium]
MLIHAATREAPELLSVDAHVPPALAQVIDQALKFDKADRFASAADFADALRAALAESEPDVSLPMSLVPATDESLTLPASAPTSSETLASATLSKTQPSGAPEARARWPWIAVAAVVCGGALFLAFGYPGGDSSTIPSSRPSAQQSDGMPADLASAAQVQAPTPSAEAPADEPSASPPAPSVSVAEPRPKLSPPSAKPAPTARPAVKATASPTGRATAEAAPSAAFPPPAPKADPFDRQY